MCSLPRGSSSQGTVMACTLGRHLLLSLLVFFPQSLGISLPFLNPSDLRKRSFWSPFRSPQPAEQFSPAEAWVAQRTLPSTWSYQGKLMDPMTGQVLAQIQGWEECQTINSTSFATRRIFRFAHDNETLSSFRMRPTSPQRIIPANQAMIGYQRIVSVRQEGDEWQLQSQDGNSTLHARGECRDGTLSLFARPGLDPTQQISKKRPWIAFGIGQPVSKYGVRETYRLEPNRIVYTRHGEAPVWYGPGRMCTMELVGTPTEEGEPDWAADCEVEAKEPNLLQRLLSFR